MNNQEQIDYWNGAAGQRWADMDQTMARLLQPITEALLPRAGAEGRRRALDVGCGGGSQSIMLGQLLGEGASVLGVDISEPMLAVARAKARQLPPGCASIEFLQADASSHPFPPASFDLVFSRFGVMFFDDPAAAFTNLHQSMEAGGRLAFSCWQSMKDNAWTWIPIQAALQHLPPPEPMAPGAPGPFAFADPERVKAILGSAGFHHLSVEPFATTLTVSEAPSLAESVRDLANIGPVARLLTDQPSAILEQVFKAMEEVLEPHYNGRCLALPGAVWFVTATSS